MTDKVQEIQKALETITAGKWEVNDFDTMYSAEIISEHPKGVFNGIASGMYVPNAHLIANAPEWLSYLLTELDAVTNDRDEWKATCEVYADGDEVKIRKAQVEYLEQENERLKEDVRLSNNAIDRLCAKNVTTKGQLKQAIEALEYYADINIMRFERITAKEALSLIREGGPACSSSE